MTRPAYELATIIQDYRTPFIQKHTQSARHLYILNAIEHCRSAGMGGHIDKCDNCNQVRVSYNSCRNRHCPKCQSANRERWIAARQ